MLVALALSVAPAVAHDVSGTTGLAPQATPTTPDISEATKADALAALAHGGVFDEHSDPLTAMECEDGFAGPYERPRVEFVGLTRTNSTFGP